VVRRLAERLTERYGRGYTYSALTRMMAFSGHYPDSGIVAPLAQQLTWTNITQVLAIEDAVKRDFYLALCARERWTKRTLRAQISGKLYERTIAARGSDDGIEAEIAALRVDGTTTPALAFRDPYVLDFLGLPAKHIVDSKDYHLDLLFYHRYLRCLVAIELKTRDLEPGDYGQMLLYLRWLQAHDRVPGEEPPIGLILCAGTGPEQTALLGLDDGEVRAARYITEPLRAEMQRRLKSSARELPPAER
jgi:predicted nuclease of restriction endonuclease-like (RecB) superfamily